MLSVRLPRILGQSQVVLWGSTRIPAIQQLKEFFGGKEPSKVICPDEAVTYSAAFQCGIFFGTKGTPGGVLVDLCLGVQITGSVFIPRSYHPTRKASPLLLSPDNQPAVFIQVFEGERSLIKDNNLLGKFEHSSIPLAPRGVPKIRLEIMKVASANKVTGNPDGTSPLLTREVVEPRKGWPHGFGS